jgi:hypothetical protein
MSQPERVETAIQRMRDVPLARREEYSLQSPGGGEQVRSAIQIDAIRDAGRDPEDPGSADQWWFRDLDLVIIDLSTDT